MSHGLFSRQTWLRIGVLAGLAYVFALTMGLMVAYGIKIGLGV